MVEDDEQVAHVLETMLDSEGYEVALAATAEAGLRGLAEQRPHLLISDYWLPDRTGAWMLGEASQRGLLIDTQVLVVTAEHRPQGVENLRVLRKPLDLDDFLRVVTDVLAPVRAQELERERQELHERHAPAQQQLPARVHFTLYISSSSTASLKALRNLRGLLHHYDPAQVLLTVCDLSRESPPEVEEDRIAFTPTLVKRSPEPKAWILGDLENAEIVADLLSHSGVERLR